VGSLATRSKTILGTAPAVHPDMAARKTRLFFVAIMDFSLVVETKEAFREISAFFDKHLGAAAR
jgi:hypothetical protein